MKLENDVLKLELCNKGGEMSSLVYKGMDVLYKGDGEYWGGKNPSLFPIISSPDKKEYTLDGKVYPIKNHGLIRYLDLETIVDNGQEVRMRLKANEETLKSYPFNFNYEISYKLDGNKVLIEYEITNNDDKVMPFTLGLHPGFIVRNFDEMSLVFDEDEVGDFIDEASKEITKTKLGEYTNFISDVERLHTVIMCNLKSKYVTLKMKEYSVKIDMTNFKYLALWTPNKDAGFMCIEPWMSINDIKHTDNPFGDEYELEHLNPGETFKTNYYIEVC